MHIQVRRVGDITVLQPAGKLTRDGGVNVKIAVVEAMQDGPAKLLCNLQDVTYVDSAGIADLLIARATVINGGGKMTLCNVTPWVAQVLALTQIDKVFGVHDSESAALASLAN